MKRTIIAGAVLLLTACGGSDTDQAPEGPDLANGTASPTSEPTAEPTEESLRTLTDEQLDKAVVRVEDLPVGFAEVAPSEDSDDGAVQGATDECTERFTLLDEISSGEPEGEAERAFEFGQGSSSLEHQWGSFESAEELDDELTQVESLFTDCAEAFLPQEDGTEIALTFTPVEVDEVGDRTVAFSATAELQGLQLSLVFHFSRVDNNIQTVFQGGLGAPEVALVNRVAALGVERLPDA